MPMLLFIFSKYVTIYSIPMIYVTTIYIYTLFIIWVYECMQLINDGWLMISWGIILAFIYWGFFKGLRLTAGRRQRNGRTRSLVVRMMRTVGPAWGNVGLS